MEGISPIAMKQANTIIQVQTSLQRKVMDTAVDEMQSLLRAMPQSPNSAGVGQNIDISV